MRATIDAFLLVGLGGALGAMARLGVSMLMAHRIVYVPLGTFASNLLGCLVMGAIVQLMASTEWFNSSSYVTDQYRLLFAVGFCGSFTTLSSMIVEMHNLLQHDELFGAFAYLFATFAAGFACFYGGAMLVRTLVH